MARSDNVISLFSGAGGFSFGFSNAGLKPVFGAEIDTDACESYENNVGSTCHKVDLSSVDPGYFKKILKDKSPFAIIGGPPCQGFSSAGVKKEGDPRNSLIFNYLKIVAEVSPQWFIFENVEGILTSGKSQDLPRLVSEFIKLGYYIKVEKVNLAGYGVPQTRKRVFIIGNKMGIDFDFPKMCFSFDSGKSKGSNGSVSAPSILDAISGLGVASNKKDSTVHYENQHFLNEYDKLMRVNNTENTISLHYNNTTPEDATRFSLLGQGQSMKDLPQEFWHDSFKRRANRRVSDGIPTERRGGAPSGIKRLCGSLQSLTITGAANREFIHPIYNRVLTIRECARLQSFPDHYDFSGNSGSAMQQIANAVPPLAAEVFANHLKMLDGKFGSDLGCHKFKTNPCLLGYKLTESLGMSPALKETDKHLSLLMNIKD